MKDTSQLALFNYCLSHFSESCKTTHILLSECGYSVSAAMRMWGRVGTHTASACLRTRLQPLLSTYFPQNFLMPLGLRLPSGVRGDWGLDSVPDEVEESSLVTPVSSQPLSVSPKVGRIEKYVNENEENLRNPTPTPELSFCKSPEHFSQCCF